MNLVNHLPYNKDILYSDFIEYNGLNQRIYFQKSYMKAKNIDQYFLKSFVIDNKGNQICQAYIYFYLNSDRKTSDFIGIYVKPAFRNLGLASLLISTWIQFCFNNGYNFLGTNKAQRKPFLIYLLKTYGFEILDPIIYQTTSNVIHICKSKNDNTKYLLFKNPKQRDSFMKGNIAKEDNYKSIEQLDTNMSYLDSVILSKEYDLLDEHKANEKSTLILNRKKRCYR